MAQKLIDRIHRKLTKMRLQPIRVFCFHQVSDEFDERTMYRCDWLQTNEFKQAIDNLRKAGYIFISLPEANDKLKRDVFRIRKYAVLTADDGWASMRTILPWLNEQQIPVTLFLNPAYLDGKHFRERDTERYLTWAEVKQLHELYPLLTIGSHGWEHKEPLTQTIDEFSDNFNRAKGILSSLPNCIPYYAFPYGVYSQKLLDIIAQARFIPLTVFSTPNCSSREFIDREIL